MGCFLGCFGPSKDRKRRKQRYKTIRRDQHQDQDQNPKSQNLMKDDVSLEHSIKDKPSNSLPELRGKIEEPLNLSTRKKVTFDANVTTYEHVQEVYDSTESLLEKNEKGETFPKSGQTHSSPDLQERSDVKNGSYPPSYRYGNCLESDDEVEDSDYEDENEDCLNDDDQEDYDNEDGIMCESSLNPVLKPVENITQWEALKSKGKVTQSPSQSNANPQKENSSLNSIPFPPKNRNQETSVNASLSNWLVSSEKNNPDLEDRPILGALTVDELKQFSGSSCTPRKSPSRSPDDMPIIGSVGSYWSSTGSAQSLSSASSYKGIPNSTSKYREDKKVSWHNTPFETRLERALNRTATD